MTGVAREDVREAFFLEHLQRLTQPIEKVRRRRVGEETALVRLQHRLPVPVRAAELRGVRSIERLLRDCIERKTRRQHEPFLRARHGDVDLPFVVPVVDRRERGDRVDEQERRVARAIHRGADLRDARSHSRRRFVVDDAQGADLVLRIGAKLLLDGGGIDAVPPVAGDELGAQIEAPRHLVPQRGEVARLEHENAIVRR